MPIQVACPRCGEEGEFSRLDAGKQVECMSCRQAFLVPRAIASGRKDRGVPSRSKPKYKALPFLTIVILALVGLRIYRSLSKRYDATPAESREEKYRSARDVYSSAREESVSSADEVAVREVLERLRKAQHDGDGEGFLDLWHLRRLVAQMEGVNGLRLTGFRQERDLVQALRARIRTMASIDGPVRASWKSLHVVRVDLHPARAEGSAFTVIRDDGIPTKMRFWLIKEAEVWKVFDLEYLELGNRLSTSVGSVVAELVQNPRSMREVNEAGEAFQEGVALLQAERHDEALERLRSAHDGMPSAMHGIVLYLEGVAELGLGEPESALKTLMRAVREQEDLPSAYLLMGRACIALERWEEALVHLQRYLGMLGDDAEAFSNLGIVYENQGRPKDAIAAYRRGITADPEGWDNEFQLACLFVEQGASKKPCHSSRRSVRNRVNSRPGTTPKQLGACWMRRRTKAFSI